MPVCVPNENMAIQDENTDAVVVGWGVVASSNGKDEPRDFVNSLFCLASTELRKSGPRQMS
jgi:hypothetical protein